MTQPSSDNVYVSLTFGNIPRHVAEEIVADAEDTAKGYDMSVDWGSPIGDQPTPVFDETADAVGSTPVVDTPAPAVPDAPRTPDQASDR